MKFSISLEFFNLDLENSPQKIGGWWVARLKISISLENFKILIFFKIWALRGGLWPFHQELSGTPKGQKSAISRRRLHWIFCFEFSPVGSFPFSPGLVCNLGRKRPQDVEKIARGPGREKSVESCHVCGCHVFFRKFPLYSVPGMQNKRLKSKYNRATELACSELGANVGRSHVV